MKWRRVTAGVILALGAILFMPRATHRESSDAPPIADIRRIHIAETEFFSRYGRYAALAELGQRGIGVLGGELAEGRSQAHAVVSLTITGSGYTIQMALIDRSGTRYRSLYSDQALIIRERRAPLSR